MCCHICWPTARPLQLDLLITLLGISSNVRQSEPVRLPVAYAQVHAQLKECCNGLLRAAKDYGITIFAIGKPRNCIVYCVEHKSAAVLLHCYRHPCTCW
jgi:hypothetical protein